MKTLVLCLLPAAALWLAAFEQSKANETHYDNMRRAAVWIITPDGTGSGSLVDADQKLLATNYHVIAGSTEVLVVFPAFRDGHLIAERQYYFEHLPELGVPGRVVVADPRRDLALVAVDQLPDDAVALSLAESGPQPGENVYSVGNPGASHALWVYEPGSVRQVYQDQLDFGDSPVVDATLVEIQSAQNPGDSGAPVVNEQGELVAVVQSRSGEHPSLSLGVEVSELRSLLNGEIKTIDRRVQAALEELEVEQTVNPLGVFEIRFPLEDGEQPVFINSETAKLGSLELREVWSPVGPMSELLAADAANQLLAESHTAKLGAWEIWGDGTERLLVFVAKVPADLDTEALRASLTGVLETARQMKEAISVARRGSEPTNDADRLAGDWLATGNKGAALALRLEADGHAVLVFQEAGSPELSVAGTYSCQNGVLTVTAGSDAVLAGTLTWIDEQKFVLETDGVVMPFERQLAP